jgi:hypothetical protein
MIIIIMRGENFVAHLDGLGGTPVAHHFSSLSSTTQPIDQHYNPISRQVKLNILLIVGSYSTLRTGSPDRYYCLIFLVS